MEAGMARNEKVGMLARCLCWMRVIWEKTKAKIVYVAKNIKQLRQEDPRRVTHSLKVGLAVALVSMFYYFQPLYRSFGDSALWAVMTVVVIFEFYVGATFGKGVNRGIATLLGAFLDFGIHHLVRLTISNNTAEQILLEFFVFVHAAISTFIRFFPKIKARYDYGLLVFILTFSLVSVSGYREEEILDFAHKRVSTVIIGCFVSMIISIVIFPVWAGEDLHNLIVLNIEKLGDSLEEFSEIFMETNDKDANDDNSYKLQGHKGVLSSKSKEESLANFASWEPRHGRFQFRYPWKEYLKIGSLTRECAYKIDTLNGYMGVNIMASAEIRSKIKLPYTNMSQESGKALKEVAMAIMTMTQPYLAELHIENAKHASKSLNSSLESATQWAEGMELGQLIAIGTPASLLKDVVHSIEKIVESVYELACKAHFKKEDPAILTEKLQIGPLDPSKADLRVNGSGIFIIKDLTPARFEDIEDPKAPKLLI